MQEAESWLIDYGNNHRNLNFGVIYWASVLALVPATVGLLWSLPIPQEFSRISPVLNWGSTFLMAALVYYFIISIALAIGMLPFIFGIAFAQIWLTDFYQSAAGPSVWLFVASLVGLFIGRIGSGGAQSVIKDIQWMMIGPIWLLSKLYRRLGIPY